MNDNNQNLLEILIDEEYYDVTIEVGNGPYIKIFRAHIMYLTLSFYKKKNVGTLVYVKLPNILPEIFK
jgi:hypothetical protein